MKKDNEYYEGLDKRSKEWNTYAKFNKIGRYATEGLGDKIENVLEKTGVKKVVKAIFGDDCGCDERKEKLNNLKLFKNKKRTPINCFTEEDYNRYKNYVERRTLTSIKIPKEAEFLNEMYIKIFATHISIDRICPSCSRVSPETKQLFQALKELDIVYESYKKDIK